MNRFDAVVIGQGYAGLVAAKLAAERGLRTAAVEHMVPGGLVMSINELEPAPAHGEPSGPELTGNLAMANMDNGIETVMGAATAIQRAADGSWTVNTDSGDYAARHVIVASGARLRKLDVPGEEEFFGRGVSECADCDGPMYMGKEAVVVGGGDSAFQEALALTQYADKVTIVMRAAAPRAKAGLVDHVTHNPKIILMAHTEVTAVLGDGSGVTGVSIRNANGGVSVLPCAGVFVFVGLKPDSAFLPSDVSRDETGAVVTDANGATGQNGLWAIGAVRSGFGGLLTDAEADAARTVAALG